MANLMGVGPQFLKLCVVKEQKNKEIKKRVLNTGAIVMIDKR
jgi:hypothetical protein